MPCYGGPIHAEHIFDEADVANIVKQTRSSHTSKAQVISPGSGKPFSGSSSLKLFTQVITYLLTEEVCWEKAVRYAVEWVKRHGGTSHHICAFRTAQQVQDVANALKAEIEQVDVSVLDLLEWVFASPDPKARPSGPSQAKIAIVGMACRFPGGADDTDKYWDLLESGRDVHQKVPADRFDIQTHFDPTGQKANATHTPFGCFVENPGYFDAAFFNLSPREAEQTDPMQRLALVTAYEALEKAGFIAHMSVDMTRIGTFYGQSSDDYREVNSGQDIGTYWISGGCRAFGPGRINYFFGFGGPSFSCDTACSSSLATIQMACTSLWGGDTDMVLAGGMNILTNSDGFAGLSKGFFLSGTGNCKTWDSQADGYCRADGVGTVVMKRLDDALADNDKILGVVTAAATNHSADAISITHPHSGNQSYLFRQVVARAGIDPLDVGYIELHGTGTQAGDSNELASVSDVFAPLHQGRTARQPLYIGAAKANVGHGEAAAGIMSLIKTLCVLQKEMIPPHVGIKNDLTPHFPQDADKRNIYIPYSKTPWPRSQNGKRISIVNNFGAAGGNTTFVIEEGPECLVHESDPRSTHVVAVSAKTVVSLQCNIERLLSYLRDNPKVPLHDLAYSLTARKPHYNYRFAFAVSDATELQKLCAPYLAPEPPIRPVRSHPPTIAFAFTGQGSFYSSMGSQLFRDSLPFRTHILGLDRLVRGQGFRSILTVLDGSAPDGYKFSLVTIHLAIVCLEMALSSLWEELGVKPSIVIGHSIGEVAALYAAGVLCASDAIFLVGQRATLLDRLTEADTYGMMAIRATPEDVRNTAQETGCDIACINGPEDIVLAGPTEALSSASKRLRVEGYKTFMLDLSQGYHSQQMDFILEEYERVAEGVVFHKPKIPVISPLLSAVVDDIGTFNVSYMRRATREAVNFMGALQIAQEQKAINEKTVWLELGPHNLCCGFIRNSIGEVSPVLPSLRKNEDNWATLSQTLCDLHCSGIQIDWKEYHRPFERALGLLDLPTYAWNNKNYWIPYLGDWALTKGNPNAIPPDSSDYLPSSLSPELRTSSIHGLIEETYNDQIARLVVETNILDSNVVEAVNGHAMNSYGVVSCVRSIDPPNRIKMLTSMSIQMVHGEIAYTLAKYLFKKVHNVDINLNMSLQNFEYHEPVVARKFTEQKQVIHTEATLETTSNVVQFRWFNVESENWYSNASITIEDTDSWLADWSRNAHLVTSRIESLQESAEKGRASKLSRELAYRLFANLVDWSEPFQGMQSVVLDRMEAVADVKLSMDDRGAWYTPPWYMESLVALSAFILNCTEVMDNKNYFFITPGFKSMRFAKPLKAGTRYLSYVKMMPMGQPNMYAGDVYILQDSEIVGVMEKIMFRQWPRVMLQRFFVAPDAKKAMASKSKSSDSRRKTSQAAMTKGVFPTETAKHRVPSVNGYSTPMTSQDSTSTMTNGVDLAESVKSPPVIVNGYPVPKSSQSSTPKLTTGAPKPSAVSATAMSNGDHSAVSQTSKTTLRPGQDTEMRNRDDVPGQAKNSLVQRALAIIADETGLEVSDLHEETDFTDLGIDSLMSLVLAQKFRSGIGVEVRDSLFIEFPQVGDLCRWLERQ